MKAWIAMQSLLFSLLIAVSLCSGVSKAQQNEDALKSDIIPKPANLQSSLRTFEATFVAFRSGNDIGEASLKLSSNKTGEYDLLYQSKVSRFFLSDKRVERTAFTVKNGSLVPSNYSYERTGTGPNKSLELKFNAAAQKVLINDKESLSWEGELENQLFRLDFPFQLSQGVKNFAYDFFNYRGQKKHYELEVVETENLSLPYGQIMAIKVMIKRDSSNRLTYAWFAPALNYNLVRLQQFKDDKEQGDIQLSEFSYL
ncbi:DUF3108 domain-containing protein [Glaciecola sp. 2405UD65-10]|uniref:DUF3108 domain-containing protein n=1 Tax=Glaciecola sp. 2405UD65-10 TaxID=3397244 RepID=UPI003B59F298